MYQASNQFIIKTHSHNIILFLHKPKALINNNIITLLVKMPVLIINIMVINMHLTHHIILHMIILNKCKVMSIHNNITTLKLELITNTTITKNLFSLIKINLLTRLINMYQNQNIKKILTSHSLFLIMVLVKINPNNLKISLKEYKHKKIIMVMLKTTKYLIFL